MNPDQRAQSKPRISPEPTSVAAAPGSPALSGSSSEPGSVPAPTRPPTDGIPWLGWLAASALPVAGVAAGIARFVQARHRAELVSLRRQQLAGFAIVGVLVAAGLAVRSHLQSRAVATPVDLEEDPPLFV